MINGQCAGFPSGYIVEEVISEMSSSVICKQCVMKHGYEHQTLFIEGYE